MTITIHFETKELEEEFWAWFLDAGGEQGFDQFLEDHKGYMMINDWRMQDGTMTIKKYVKEE